MGGEFENKKEQPLIGTDLFGLTESNVLEAIEETKKDIDGFRNSLKDESENLRSFASKALPGKEEDLKTLTQLSPPEILAKMKACYDKIIELTNAGLSTKEIVTRIRVEFPGLMTTYYKILNKDPWGYRLGQAIVAEKSESGD